MFCLLGIVGRAGAGLAMAKGLVAEGLENATSLRFKASMIAAAMPFLLRLPWCSSWERGRWRFAQSFGDPAAVPASRRSSPMRRRTSTSPLATIGHGAADGFGASHRGSPPLDRGLVWRVFKPEPGPDGRLPLVASAQGGTGVFDLEPGSYLVHASFGRAGATKRIRVGNDSWFESLVLEAGGLKLDAVLSGGVRIPAEPARFSIYEAEPTAVGERALIVPDVSPNTVVGSTAASTTSSPPMAASTR
jgi:hypothetical protein